GRMGGEAVKVSRLDVMSVARKRVTPVSSIARIARATSSVLADGSPKSTPAKPLTCRSTRPGSSRRRTPEPRPLSSERGRGRPAPAALDDGAAAKAPAAARKRRRDGSASSLIRPDLTLLPLARSAAGPASASVVGSIVMSSPVSRAMAGALGVLLLPALALSQAPAQRTLDDVVALMASAKAKGQVGTARRTK